MSWETNQPPLEYLKRRIVYYKKKRGRIKRMMTKYIDFVYTKEEINKAVIRVEDRIKEFEDAVSTLSVEKLKRMRIKK